MGSRLLVPIASLAYFGELCSSRMNEQQKTPFEEDGCL